MLSGIRTSLPARMVKRLARRGDDWLAGVVRAASPWWKPRVLFPVSNSFGYDAQEPVIRALLDRGRVRVSVAGARERGVAPRRIAGLAALGVPDRSHARSRHGRYDAIVLTDVPQARYWRGGKRIYLHHGSAFFSREVHYAFDLMRRGAFEYLLALHETEVVRGCELFGDGLRERAAVVGQPKLDRLLAREDSSGQVLPSLGLDPARPTLLFMSHWTSTSLLHTCGEDVLRFLADRRDVNVLVTAHSLLWSRSDQADWRARLAWVDATPHMRLLPSRDDIAELMRAADVSITDHTSATLEYAALHRPMILYRNPSQVFTEPHIEALMRRTACVFTAPDGFPAAFTAAMSSRSCHQPARAQLLEACLSHLGSSGPRTALAVEQVAWNGRFEHQAV